MKILCVQFHDVSDLQVSNTPAGLSGVEGQQIKATISKILHGLPGFDVFETRQEEAVFISKPETSPEKNKGGVKIF